MISFQRAGDADLRLREVVVAEAHRAEHAARAVASRPSVTVRERGLMSTRRRSGAGGVVGRHGHARECRTAAAPCRGRVTLRTASPSTGGPVDGDTRAQPPAAALIAVDDVRGRPGAGELLGDRVVQRATDGVPVRDVEPELHVRRLVAEGEQRRHVRVADPGLGPLGDGQTRARLGVVRLDVDAQEVLQELDALGRGVRRAGEAVTAAERRVGVALAARGQGEREPAEVVAQAGAVRRQARHDAGVQWPIKLHRRARRWPGAPRSSWSPCCAGGLEEAVLERRGGEERLQVLPAFVKHGSVKFFVALAAIIVSGSQAHSA